MILCSVMASPNTTFPVKDSVWTVSCLLAVTSDIAFAFYSCSY